jgi:phytoene dehydrogenase-like protein
LRLLPPEAVPPELGERLRHGIAHQPWSLFSVHLALAELPSYEAAAFDPDVDRAWVVNLGYSTPAELAQDFALARVGRLSERPRPNAAVNSLCDPTDAPPGSATGLLRQIAPYALAGGGPAAWDELGRFYAERCIAAWRRVAPNLEGKAVLDWVPCTPADIARKLPNMVEGDWVMGRISLDDMMDQRPLPELAQYRTPVEGLYLAGSTQHPHGFITFAPAYNALSVPRSVYRRSPGDAARRPRRPSAWLRRRSVPPGRGGGPTPPRARRSPGARARSIPAARRSP